VQKTGHLLCSDCRAVLVQGWIFRSIPHTDATQPKAPGPALLQHSATPATLSPFPPHPHTPGAPPLSPPPPLHTHLSSKSSRYWWRLSARNSPVISRSKAKKVQRSNASLTSGSMAQKLSRVMSTDTPRGCCSCCCWAPAAGASEGPAPSAGGGTRYHGSVSEMADSATAAAVVAAVVAVAVCSEHQHEGALSGSHTSTHGMHAWPGIGMGAVRCTRKPCHVLLGVQLTRPPPLLL
jgi:hypothetical protein